MAITFEGETAEYRAARDRLLQSEIALRRQMEAVAAERRALPPGPLVQQDYTFQRAGAGGQPEAVRLSELFRPGTRSLLIYNMMFPRHVSDDRAQPENGPMAALPRQETPCPSCTALLDQLNGAAPHFAGAGYSFAAVAQAPIEPVAAFARHRGWDALTVVSAAGISFKKDFNALFEDGQLAPMSHVFRKDADGIRHFWSSEMLFADSDPGQDPRQQGTIEPLWNMMDLMPEGRPNFDEQMQYGESCCHSGAPAA